jgi:carbon-monoxide dehydrogenase medium subunit
MLLPPFQLHRASSISEAVGLLDSHEESVVYMGGTELLLLMKLGMANPEHLIDCKRVPGLREIRVTESAVQIGAAVTHREIERHAALRERLPVLSEMTRQVANVRVRNAGTLLGNLCFAEPHSDPATLLLALDAQVEVASATGIRWVALADFIHGPLQTALGEAEVAASVSVPLPPVGTQARYQRFATHERPSANVAVVTGGPPGNTRVVAGAVGPRPIRIPAVEVALENHVSPSRSDVASAVAETLEAYDDENGRADYKTHIVGVLVSRAIAAIGEPTSRQRKW